MFKLAKKTTVDWPVTVSIPQDDGRVTKATFSAKFEVIGQREHDDIVYNAGGELPRDLLKRVLIGWKGVATEDGTDKEFNDEACAELLDITYARAALYEAYGKAANGKGREKN